MLDFEAITDFWWGDLPEPKFPFEPVTLERLELVNPFERPTSDKAPENEEG